MQYRNENFLCKHNNLPLIHEKLMKLLLQTLHLSWCVYLVNSIAFCCRRFVGASAWYWLHLFWCFLSAYENEHDIVCNNTRISPNRRQLRAHRNCYGNEWVHMEMYLLLDKLSFAMLKKNAMETYSMEIYLCSIIVVERVHLFRNQTNLQALRMNKY